MATGVEEAVTLLIEDIGTLSADHHLRIARRVFPFERRKIGKEVPDVPLGPVARSFDGGSGQ
jgi:hypothetical protein